MAFVSLLFFKISLILHHRFDEHLSKAGHAE